MIGRQISRFYVIRSLGSGGMGMVYEAQDTRLPRSVAIKFLKPALASSKDAVRRFRREARLASTLNHPNICTILDVDVADGLAFIAMELLQGQSLKQRLTGSALGLDEIVDIGVQVSSALAAAHAQGILHRDITPGNIFVTESGLVKLLDFGLAKQFATSDDDSSSDDLTDPGGIVGTVHYMAPERFSASASLDARSDLYSLGAVLYQMACGARPFEAPSKQEVISLILERPPVPLRRLAPQHPAALERLIDTLLRKRPADRYANAALLQADLEALREQTRPRPPVEPRGTRETAIAVLPFRVLGGDPDAAISLGEGLADDVSAHLSQLRGVRVAPRTSTRQVASESIREIGRRLDVPLVLEGSVQQAPDQLRVIASVIAAADERPLGPSVTVSRQGTQLLQVQDDVARELATRLATSLPSTSATLTTNVEAFNAYKRGQHHWQSRFSGGWQQAIEEFQFAVDRDPRFALGHVALGSAYEFLGFYTLMKPAPAFSAARRFIERALELDESLSIGHTEMALIRFGGDWDWDGSEQSFRRALALEPSNAFAHVCYSWLLILLGREDAAFAEAATGHRLAPASRFIASGRAQTLYLARRYDDTIELSNECLRDDPDYVFALALRGQCFELKGMFAEAVADLERAANLTRRMPFYVGMLGHCYGNAGMRTEAQTLLKELDYLRKTTYVPPQCYVYVHAGLGDGVKALQYQEEAYADGASPFNYLVPSIRNLYALDPLHKKRLEQMRLVL